MLRDCDVEKPQVFAKFVRSLGKGACFYMGAATSEPSDVE